MLEPSPHFVYEHPRSSQSAHVVHVHHKPRVRTLGATWSVVLGMVLSGVIFGIVSLVKFQQTPAITTSQAASNTPTTSQPVNQVSAPAPIEKIKPIQPSSKDLLALIKSWEEDYSDASLGVTVKELGGDKRTASLNGDKQFFAASLYKLFMADYLYSKATSGTLNLSSSLGTSKSLGTCLELMIVVSDNECPEAIGYAIGWYNLQNFAQGRGFSKTTMAPNTTTANDTADYLVKLQQGTLIAASYRENLLSNMSRQIFRSGIPAGTGNIKVADKVGFNYGNWHDGAIVYHPKGTYVLVVMTNGTGPGAISDLSSRINKFFNK